MSLQGFHIENLVRSVFLRTAKGIFMKLSTSINCYQMMCGDCHVCSVMEELLVYLGPVVQN